MRRPVRTVPRQVRRQVHPEAQGHLLIGAMEANDLPMVQTLTFIFAVLIVLFNLIADILYGILDPRIRYD